MSKVPWTGQLVSVQPRIRLTRSFDIRTHTYLGYALWVHGKLAGGDADFWLGIGKAAQEKHRFEAGDMVAGECEPVRNTKTEAVDYYKASKLQVLAKGPKPPEGPPRQTTPLLLEEYRKRGHRRLDPRTYEAKCKTCMWGCRMAVEMIIDQWNPRQKRYRHETFCYGPLNCKSYSSGPRRKVPGRKGMTWEEPDWVDQEAVSHRESENS